MGNHSLLHRSGVVLCLALAVSQSVLAGGGSIYSRLGLGDLHPGANARSAGMGYTGIAFATPTTINTLAPATWSKIDRARIEGGLMYEGFSSSDGMNSRYLARTDFNGAMLALPVSPDRGIVVAFGFVPYSNVDYSAFSSGKFVTPTDTLTNSIAYTGSGGITKGQLGVSYSPTKTLALGISLNYLFGTIDYSTEISSPSETYASGRVTENLGLRGLNFTGGLMFNGFGDVSEALRPLSIGVVLSTRAALKTTDRYYYYFESSTLLDTSQESAGELIVPMSLGLGLAYQANERTVLTADFSQQGWASAQLNDRPLSNIRNASTWGVGAEYLPSRDASSASFLNRVAYRFGFYYASTYYTLNGEPINAWGATAGFGIPISGETRLHLALEYGKRGTTNSALISDTIYRVTASLSISELWFARYEED